MKKFLLLLCALLGITVGTKAALHTEVSDPVQVTDLANLSASKYYILKNVGSGFYNYYDGTQMDAKDSYDYSSVVKLNYDGDNVTIQQLSTGSYYQGLENNTRLSLGSDPVNFTFNTSGVNAGQFRFANNDLYMNRYGGDTQYPIGAATSLAGDYSRWNIYEVTIVEGYTVVYSAATGSFTATNPAGNWARAWQSTATNPTVTLTTGANNIDVATGNIYSGSSGCTYTLTASAGYVITGYTIVGTAKTEAQTLTPAEGGDPVTFDTDKEYTLTVSGLSTSSTSFTQSTPNKGITITSFIITLDDNAATVEYVISDGKVEVFRTGAVNTTVGTEITELPEAFQRPYCSYNVTPKTMAEGSNTVEVTVSYNLPFTVSESFADATWYYATIRGSKYLRADDDAKDSSGRYATNATNEKTDAYKWAFFGNPYTYLYVMNKNQGEGKYMAKETQIVFSSLVDPTADNNALWEATPNSNGGFTLRNIGGGSTWYVNDSGNNGNLGFWNSSWGKDDAGSNWTISEVPSATVDVTYELWIGGEKINTIVDEQVGAESEIAIPAALISGYSALAYDFVPSGTIGTENCTITVTGSLKEGVVTALSQLSNAKAYTLNTARGSLGTNGTQMVSTNGTSYVASNFAIINYKDNYYLYSVADSKWVGNPVTIAEVANQPQLTEDLSAVSTLVFDDANVTAESPLFFMGYGTNGVNVSNYATGVVVNSWTTRDPGNQYCIIEAADFDATAALAALDAYFFDAATAIVNPSFEACEAVAESIGTTADSQGTDYETLGWKLTQAGPTWSNAAVFAYGADAQLNGVSAPTIVPEGCGEKALGVTVGWGGAEIYQSAEAVTIPAGTYTLLAYAYNANAGAEQLTSKLAFVPTVGEAYTSTTNSFAYGNWVVDYVTFTLTESTEGKFQIGGAAISGGSGSNAKVFFDGLTLTDADGLAAAQAKAVAANAAILQAKIDANLALVDGASATAPKDAPFVVNGTFSDNVNGWTCTGGFQNQAKASNQNGAFTVPFFENWHPDAKVNKMYQTIELIPNGTYKLNIAAFVNTLADPNESQYVFANNDKVFLTTGEPTAYEVWTVVTDNTLEIGLEQTTATANWMGIDNVSLTYYGEGDVIAKARDGYYTDHIVNADLTGEGGFDTTGTKGIDGSGIVKAANNAQFDFKQTITVPAGKYKLTAQAAYRYSGSEADEAAAIAAGTETKFAKLYAITATKTPETLVQNRYDGASETDYAAGNGSVQVGELYVPNSSNAVKAWFEAGKYVNELVFNQVEDGNVTIGIVKTAMPDAGDYTVIGPWTLTRIGDAESEAPQFNITVADIENGTVEVDKATAEEGEKVTVTVTPNAGYMVDEAYWTYNETKTDFAEPEEGNKASFTMPAADVTVTVLFKPITLQPGDDATAFITNPSFETGDLTGWSVGNSSDTGVRENSNGTYATEGCDGSYLFNTWWQGIPITQTVTGLPNGLFELKALMANDSKTAGNQPCLYLLANGEHSEAFQSETAGKFVECSMRFYVTNGEATIGAIGGNADGSFNEGGYYWYKVDNFRLTYVEALPDMADIEVPEGKMSNTAKAAITAAQQAGDVLAMLEAVKNANASIAAYAKANSAIEAARDVLYNTNVTTAEATQTFTNTINTAWIAYDEGTMSDDEANVLGNTLGVVVTQWHAGADGAAVKFMESAYNLNGFDAPLYINTWSIEGENDGTGFVVPFYEYFVGDNETLAANTFTTTVSNLEAGKYDVSAWIRVQMKNGETTPYGVTLDGNGGEAVDAIGEEATSANLYLKETTATAFVGKDGILSININVLDGNNIHWLSFKNVKFEKSMETGIENVATEVGANKTMYDLTGRRVTKAVKNGLYIINGRVVRK